MEEAEGTVMIAFRTLETKMFRGKSRYLSSVERSLDSTNKVDLLLRCTGFFSGPSILQRLKTSKIIPRRCYVKKETKRKSPPSVSTTSLRTPLKKITRLMMRRTEDGKNSFCC